MKKQLLYFLAFFIINFSYAQNSESMYAHYVNVGQANSAILEFPCGVVLIDAGAQDDKYEQKLLDYLEAFFAKREDLNRTIDLIIVTHCHIDHNSALDKVVENFTVKNYIDNGLHAGSGKPNQNWLQKAAKDYEIEYEAINFEKIKSKAGKDGYTNEIIDPINCTGVDPKITLLSAGFKTQPSDWSATDFGNGNNHSIVIKVEYNKSSFLFLGDLEKRGIKNLLKYYSSTTILDSDVLLVSHHGAENGTTKELLDAITPSNAVISCGKWNYGLGPNDPAGYTTFKYGHPRRSTTDLLAESIEGTRSKEVKVKLGEAGEVFKLGTVKKKIYATPWDKNIIISATKDGDVKVTTGN